MASNLVGGVRGGRMRSGYSAIAVVIAMTMMLVAGVSGPNAQVGVQGQEMTQPSVALPPELQRVLTDYEGAWSKKDSLGLAKLFAEDGFVLAPGNPMVRGREAIERQYRGSGGPLSLRAVAYAAEGSVGYIIGAFSARAGIPDRGKFTLTLRRDAAGKWWIVSDMDNGNGKPVAKE